MAFDGVPYVSPALISPIAHHPAAPMTGQALAGALTTAYSSARNDARLIMQQTYGSNGQDPASGLSVVGLLVLQTSYVRLARPRCNRWPRARRWAIWSRRRCAARWGARSREQRRLWPRWMSTCRA